MKKIIAFLIVAMVSMICTTGAFAENESGYTQKDKISVSREVAKRPAPMTDEQKADMVVDGDQGFVSPQAMFEGRGPAQRPAPMSDEEKADMVVDGDQGYVSPQERAAMKRS